MRKLNWKTWAVLGILSLLIIAAVTLKLSRPSARKAIGLDANGDAHFYGVPLRQPILRDMVFKTAAWCGYTGGVAILGRSTNQTQLSNMVASLQAATRTGLLGTNAPAKKPNPYE